jgi:hypothetical protein
MKRYGLDPDLVSTERFIELTRSKRLVPGRRILLEKMEMRFGALKAAGIETLGQLISALDNKEKIKRVASSTGIPERFLEVLKREAGSYMAKTFPLSGFPGIPYEYTEILKSLKIRNTKDFFESVQTDEERKEVASRTGIPESRLKEMYCLCDLSRITGVGGTFARIIYDSGIRSTLEFITTDVDEHYEKYREVMERRGGTVHPPSKGDIRYCIDYARVICEMVESP